MTGSEMAVRSYWGMHRRLIAVRGPASAQRCAECRGPAVLWCYDGTDRDERRDPAGGHRYSLDPTRYRPRCRRCHRHANEAQRYLTAALAGRMVCLYQDGASLAQIAAQLGIGRTAVRSALLAHGVALRPPGSRSRIAVDAERAAALYAAGASLRGVAELLGASVAAVRAAVTARGVAIRIPGPTQRRNDRAARGRTTPSVPFRPLPTISHQPLRPTRQPDQP